MGRSAEEIKKDIESGNTALGIEFGSTRIKAVLTDGTTAPIAQGSYEWENRLENGIWILFPGRYLERLKGLLRGSGCRCEETIRFNA